MDYIGIFDSGIGGLGIFKEIKKILPKENIIYLADSANFPYGEKSIDQIQKICKNNIRFLLKKGAKIIVIACNSASVSALNYLRTEFPLVPIIGVVPVVKTAAKMTKNKKIGILATKVTIESGYLKSLVEEFCPKKNGYKVFYQSCGELVSLIEKNINGKKRKIVIAKSLQKFIKERIDVLALGCTHFPFAKKEIESILGKKVLVLDSNSAVARHVKRVLEKNHNLNFKNGNKYIFYSSGDATKLAKIINDLIGFDIKNIKILSKKV